MLKRVSYELHQLFCLQVIPALPGRVLYCINSTHVAISCFLCRWSRQLPGRALYCLRLYLFHPRGNQLFCLQVVLVILALPGSYIYSTSPTWQSVVCLQVVPAIPDRVLYCIYSAHVAISCLSAGGPGTYLTELCIVFDCIYSTHVAISCCVCRWFRHLPGRVLYCL
jgi:hypothetical protein